MAVTNEFLRKRAIALQDFQPSTKLDEKLRKRVVKQLKWGFINPVIKEDYDKFIEHLEAQSNAPLAFHELTSNSTWFQLHPDRVAGEEVGKTSFIFPVTIKGGKKEALAVINRILKEGVEDKSDDDMTQLELEALAEIEILKLITLNA